MSAGRSGRTSGTSGAANYDTTPAGRPSSARRATKSDGNIFDSAPPSALPSRPSKPFRPKSSSPAWTGPGETKKVLSVPDGSKGTSDIIGMAVWLDPTHTFVTSIMLMNGFGKIYLVHMESSGKVYRMLPPEPFMVAHYGPVYALATAVTPAGTLMVTGGDDCNLLLRDVERWSMLLARCRTPAPVRCLDICPDGLYVACGMAGGLITIHAIEPASRRTSTAFQRPDSSTMPAYTLSKLTGCRDVQRDITDIKFSPNVKMLAVGSHERVIDIYLCKFRDPVNSSSVAVAELKRIKRLKGHNSYITHLDWSADNRLLRSNCGAYEILFWDVVAGTQMVSSLDTTVETDTEWYSQTCILGFPVMGIWHEGEMGTSINTVDVDNLSGLVATGDDFGQLRLLNYPCVVKKPGYIELNGHSSHVMCVRFIRSASTSNPKAPLRVITTGGNDCSVMIWKINQRLR